MKDAYADCLKTANGSNDPDLSRLRSTATAYIALADGALAMYDGADVYAKGRAQMVGGDYQGAADAFGSAAATLATSRSLFDNATAGLQSAGSPNAAALLPLLQGKAAYVGEFAALAEGWQHTGHAYRAREKGNDYNFWKRASLAAKEFDGLRSSSAFGADASADFDILAARIQASEIPALIIPLEPHREAADLLRLSVESVDPASMPLDEASNLQIHGTGFQPGARVVLKDDRAAYEAVEVEVVSMNLINCRFNFFGEGFESIGDYNVWVGNPAPGATQYDWEGHVSEYIWKCLPWGVRLKYGIFGIEPGWGNRGETIDLRITGPSEYTTTIDQVELRNADGTTMTPSIEAVTPQGSNTVLECTLDIPSDAVPGEYVLYTDLYTDLAEGIAGRTGNVFRVVDGPTITGWDYNCQPRGSAKIHQLGTLDLEPGVQLRLRDDEGTIIEATGETLVGEVGQLRITLDIPLDAALAYWDVEVRNPGTTAWIRQDQEFLVVPNPVIYSITPHEAMAGETVTVTITGRDFISRNGQVVGILHPYWNSILTQVPSDVNLIGGDGPNVVTFTVTIPPGISPDYLCSIQVINLGDCCNDIPSTMALMQDSFRITQGYSKVTSVSPSQIHPGQTTYLYIEGINFKPHAQVKLKQGAYEIRGEDEQVAGTFVTCSVGLNGWPAPPLGPYDVYVENPSTPEDPWGTENYPLENGVTVV